MIQKWMFGIHCLAVVSSPTALTWMNVYPHLCAVEVMDPITSEMRGPSWERRIQKVQRFSSTRLQGFKDEDLGYSPDWWAASVVNYCPSRPSQLFANNRNKTWQTNKVIYVRNSWVCPTLLSLLLRHSDWDWDLGDGEQSDKRIYVFSFSIPFEKDHFRTSISFLWH